MLGGRPRSAGLHVSWRLALVGAAAAAGVALRVAVQTSSLGVPDGDEAVWGLMARHVLHGHVTAFFWGQAYGGTQEIILTAPLFAVFGSSMLLARLVPMALVAVAAILVWRIGRRTVGEPAATIAAALFWVWPPYLIWKSDRAHGFYGSGLVLTELVLLLALRLLERPSRRDSLLLGLVVGLAWWQTPQVVPVALPALAYLAIRRRQDVARIALYGLPLAVLGSLPWWISNVRHHWWSLNLDSGQTPYFLRLRGFFSATLPMAVGLRETFTSRWLLGAALSGVIYVVVLAVLAFLLWRNRGRNVAVLGVVAIAYPFLYAVSQATWIVDEPRYVVLLVPVLVLLLAQVLHDLRWGAAAVALAVGVSVATLSHLSSSRAYDQRADGLFVPHDLDPLVAALDARGITRVFADYWVAYRLDFATRERIVAAETNMATVRRRGDGRILPDRPQNHTESRYPAYDTLVRRLDRPPYALIAGSAEEARVGPLLRQAGYGRERAGGFALYQLPSAVSSS